MTRERFQFRRRRTDSRALERMGATPTLLRAILDHTPQNYATHGYISNVVLREWSCSGNNDGMGTYYKQQIPRTASLTRESRGVELTS